MTYYSFFKKAQNHSRGAVQFDRLLMWLQLAAIHLKIRATANILCKKLFRSWQKIINYQIENKNLISNGMTKIAKYGIIYLIINQTI